MADAPRFLCDEMLAGLKPSLSRCTLCNTRLELADRRLLDTLLPRIRALGPTVHVCPHCGRLYWEGSHIRPHAPARRSRFAHCQIVVQDYIAACPQGCLEKTSAPEPTRRTRSYLVAHPTVCDQVA